MTSYIKIDQPEIIALLFPPQNSDFTPSPANAEDVSFEIDPQSSFFPLRSRLLVPLIQLRKDTLNKE